ncbi:MAG: hypothetical protein RRY20_05415, partial [Bilophila sp.]
ATSNGIRNPPSLNLISPANKPLHSGITNGFKGVYFIRKCTDLVKKQSNNPSQLHTKKIAQKTQIPPRSHQKIRLSVCPLFSIVFQTPYTPFPPPKTTPNPKKSHQNPTKPSHQKNKP